MTALAPGSAARIGNVYYECEEDFIFDEDEMDIPSFIRMQAD